MSNDQPRKPAGTPAGGEFSHKTGSAPSGGLAVVGDDWGRVGYRSGQRTPWGVADFETFGPGFVSVSTPGHGGIKLSSERNSQIPAPLRNRSGWYEEDCEAAIPLMFMPDIAQAWRPDSSLDDISADAEDSVKNWFPDQYTAATGNPVDVSESTVLQDRQKRADADAYRAAHADEYVSTRYADPHAAWLPEGFAVVEARKDSTGEVAHFLIPKSETVDPSGRQSLSNVLIDPRRHRDVSHIVAAGVQPEPEPPLLTGDQVRVSFDGLTDRQRSKAADELSRRYRFRDDDGEHVESLAAHFARVGVYGKAMAAFGNKAATSFYVQFPYSRIMEVSKAAWEALDIPDRTTEESRLSVERRNIEARVEKYRYDLSPAGRERHAAAAADLDRVSAELKSVRDEWMSRARSEREAATARQKALYAEMDAL